LQRGQHNCGQEQQQRGEISCVDAVGPREREENRTVPWRPKDQGKSAREQERDADTTPETC
jgi:hypothetical protein